MSLAQIKLDARNYLEERDAKLQCMDFKGRVTITHQDGSLFELSYALAEKKTFGNFKLLMVWTEHCGSFFFFTDDIETWYYTPYEIQNHQVQNSQERTEGSKCSEQRSDDH